MNAGQVQRLVAESGIEQIRLSWCDLHGDLRGKTVMPGALASALGNGIGLVGTLALKDTSDRTAFKVFEEGGLGTLPEFANAGNLILRPEPKSYRHLPWADKTAWLQGQVYFTDGRPVQIDTRQVLKKALAALEGAGYAMQCGLEVEFHIYKIENTRPELDPELAAWGALPPAVSMVHPGYRLLSEQWMDRADAPLAIVRRTAQALGLPLTSLEIELGPSQVEAVFDVTDALTAADNMVLFRSATTQALRRAGYHATFMCRPPFPSIMSSGWHLHQSLVHLETRQNAFLPTTARRGADPLAASSHLSPVGTHYLAGLLAHASACTALSNPTINAYARFQPNALAPQSIIWGADNRGAMLRVINSGEASRIENRVGEPLANPYLYFSSQIYAGLDGLQRTLAAPKATLSPYQNSAAKLPTSLHAALDALEKDTALTTGLGSDFVQYFAHIKRQEIARYEAAEDAVDWQRREYFARY